MIENGTELWTFRIERNDNRCNVVLIRAPYLNDGTMIINGYIIKIEEGRLFETRYAAKQGALDYLWRESGKYAVLATMFERGGGESVSISEDQITRALGDKRRPVSVVDIINGKMGKA